MEEHKDKINRVSEFKDPQEGMLAGIKNNCSAVSTSE